MTSVKGGTRGAASAKLILKAKANGTRKNIKRKISGGRMMSQRPGAQFVFMIVGLRLCPRAIVRDKLASSTAIGRRLR